MMTFKIRKKAIDNVIYYNAFDLGIILGAKKIRNSLKTYLEPHEYLYIEEMCANSLGLRNYRYVTLSGLLKMVYGIGVLRSNFDYVKFNLFISDIIKENLMYGSFILGIQQPEVKLPEIKQPEIEHKKRSSLPKNSFYSVSFYTRRIAPEFFYLKNDLESFLKVKAIQNSIDYKVHLDGSYMFKTQDIRSAISYLENKK